MPGTKAGGLKAAATNKRLYGENFYANIGRRGGENGHAGGFAANPALAKLAGKKGGSISRRGSSQESKRVMEINREEIMQMYDDMIPVTKIAAKFGINPATMRNWIRQQ